MLSFKRKSLKSILESEEGVHLSLYLKGDQNFSKLKLRFEEILNLAEAYLEPIMSLGDRKKFLSPIRKFAFDESRLAGFGGSIAVFKNENYFRIIRLPFEVENSCNVAGTYHVKPLLKWIQFDRDFLLLGVESGKANLYQGNLDSLRLIDSLSFPKSNPDSTKAVGATEREREILGKEELVQTANWLNEWIMKLSHSRKTRLFVVGKKILTRGLCELIRHKSITTISHPGNYTESNVLEKCSQIRAKLKADAQWKFENDLMEFQYASVFNIANGNIFTIGRAAVQGKVKKLILSGDTKIFGKFNRKNGDVVVHPFDLDHEDDDLLDDIAQTVLAHGGIVTVASADEIPKGQPILAIIDDSRGRKSALRQVKKRMTPMQEERKVQIEKIEETGDDNAAESA